MLFSATTKNKAFKETRKYDLFIGGKKRKLTQTVPKEAQILKKIINQRANRNNRHHSRRSMFPQIENIVKRQKL